MTYRTAPTPAARLRAALLSALFLVSFIVSVALTVLLVYAIVAWFFRLRHPEWFSGWHGMWCRELFKNLCVPTSLVMFLGAAHRIHELSGSDAARELADSFGGRLLRRDDCHPREAEILDLAEDVARKAGLSATPSVYILGDDGSINAFAAGEDVGGMVIGITRGAVEVLEPEELRALIAHECVHLRSGDTRLNVRLAGFLHGILLFSLIGMWFFRTAFRGRGRSFRGGGQILLVLVLVAGALVVAGVVGRFVGQLLQLALSRQREYHADAAAIEIVGSPRGLAGALKKIGGWSEGSALESFDVQGVNHFFFADGLHRRVLGLLSSHPDLHARIRRIQPNWHGVFRPVAVRRDESWEQDLALRRLGGDDPLAGRERDGRAGWMRPSVVTPPPQPICADPLPPDQAGMEGRQGGVAGHHGTGVRQEPFDAGATGREPPPLPSSSALPGGDRTSFPPPAMELPLSGSKLADSHDSALPELHSLIVHFPTRAGEQSTSSTDVQYVASPQSVLTDSGKAIPLAGGPGPSASSSSPPPHLQDGCIVQPPSALPGLPRPLESLDASCRPGALLIALSLDPSGSRRAAQIDALLPRLGRDFVHDVDATAFEIDAMDTAGRLDAVEQAIAELRMLPPDAWPSLLDALAASIRAAGAVTGFRFCLHLLAVHEHRKIMGGWRPASRLLPDPAAFEQGAAWIALVAKYVTRRADQFRLAYAAGISALGQDPVDHPAPAWESVSLKGAGKTILGLAELGSPLRRRISDSCFGVVACGDGADAEIWMKLTAHLLDPGEAIQGAANPHPWRPAAIGRGAQDVPPGSQSFDPSRPSPPPPPPFPVSPGSEVRLVRKSAPHAMDAAVAGQGATDSPSMDILDSDCPGCHRKGFRWARNTCSYCGFEIDADFSGERSRRDALLGQELLAQELRRVEELRRERERSQRERVSH